MQQTEPCLPIIRQIKNALAEIGVEMKHINEQNYRPWKLQEGEEDKIKRKQQRQLPLYPGVSILDGLEIPVHLIEYYERNKGEIEEEEAWEKATALQKKKEEMIQELERQGDKGWQANSGVRMKQKGIRKIEEIVGEK